MAKFDKLRQQSIVRRSNRAIRRIEKGEEPLAALSRERLTLEQLAACCGQFQLPDRWQERLLASGVGKAVVPVFVRNGNNRWAYEGTAVSFFARNRMWLLTAAHVLENPWGRPIAIPLHDRLEVVVGRQMRVARPSTASNEIDAYDAAVVCCDGPQAADIAQQYPPMEEANIAEAGLGSQGHLLTFSGIPARTMELRKDGTRHGVNKCLTGATAPSSWYDALDCSETFSIVMETNPKKWRNTAEDRIESQGNLSGMSGGPIMRWPKNECGGLGLPQLAGIGTYWCDRKGVMVGTRIEFLMAILDDWTPQPAVLARLGLLARCRT